MGILSPYLFECARIALTGWVRNWHHYFLRGRPGMPGSATQPIFRGGCQHETSMYNFRDYGLYRKKAHFFTALYVSIFSPYTSQGNDSLFLNQSFSFLCAFNMGFVTAFCFSILLLTFSNPTSASSSKDCDFPAIFNFGDSISDTGGISAAFTTLPWPHGISYFHMPAGRYSDGRLPIDFMGTF